MFFLSLKSLFSIFCWFVYHKMYTLTGFLSYRNRSVFFSVFFCVYKCISIKTEYLLSKCTIISPFLFICPKGNKNIKIYNFDFMTVHTNTLCAQLKIFSSKCLDFLLRLDFFSFHNNALTNTKIKLCSSIHCSHLSSF